MHWYAAMIGVLCNDRTVCVEHYEVICNHTKTTPPPVATLPWQSVSMPTSGAGHHHTQHWPTLPPPPSQYCTSLLHQRIVSSSLVFRYFNHKQFLEARENFKVISNLIQNE